MFKVLRLIKIVFQLYFNYYYFIVIQNQDFHQLYQNRKDNRIVIYYSSQFRHGNYSFFYFLNLATFLQLMAPHGFVYFYFYQFWSFFLIKHLNSINNFLIQDQNLLIQ